MKKECKGWQRNFLIALLMGIITMGSAGAIGTQTVDLTYSGIQVELNGQIIHLTDANGNFIEPFSIAGTTYLPLRAVADALGVQIKWDADTSTIVLSNNAGGIVPIANQTRSADNSYGIGETWIVDGQWAVTVTGIHETAERNEYSDKNPGAVYVIDYTYTNLGYTKENWDGLFMPLDDVIVDSAGKVGYSYPNSVDGPTQTPVGATCDAQECIGVENPGDVRITVSLYDGNDNRQSATFLINVP